MLQHWIAANMVEGVGPVKLKKLLEQHGSIVEVCQVLNAPLEKSLQVIDEAARDNIKILSREDENYPELLKNIYDPPPVLFIKGEVASLAGTTIAIVGTRQASRYGKEIAQKFAFELASLGLTVVSGLALGIDTAAHQGALEAKGKTIAVFGCGVDYIYPPSNRDLAREIESSGALVSEFPLGTGVEKGHFPRRNRIISGLSLGTIVVEGHYDSGAMITAKFALDQGREVFAVPGNIELDQSKGPHWLIKQGAKLVETVDDILEELNLVRQEKMSNDRCSASGGSNEGRDYSNLSLDEQKIVKTLSLEPRHIDDIAQATSLSTPQVSSLLMMLEVKKILRQLPGKMFVLYPNTKNFGVGVY
ncbi:DNA protecting protein DprA [candidate division WOR-1 bacterium RIFCSPLOWO2_02_FULL_46_20]|uniref:DNA protecting protein DprA n=2 Tax=Saganbacteria TaxID=1703751 RepID=A0A1F4RAG4_UNCSA|nr:MAG: DNA protecting protein DprA [candidate division WOR-1 bacterium RIFCSPHIGHO2_02_FULL_45_12]OGC04513.1 MAG: DNA protecting protein DprA [candidate division WOR-1 bacterium RIFCSPLOWO2_02_FULL_46_20]OGC09344.1 MAG: DNA protecting protein DprA [candidate division WOR-1 bacterium RIFCSPLOWO2_12_FULL_45_9]